MALTGITGYIHDGYTGNDHLIDDGDRDAVRSAIAGHSFRRLADAINAAERAYLRSCDRRCSTARVTVEVRNARGDIVRGG